MLAKYSTARSFRPNLAYLEAKIKIGKSACIQAENFIKYPSELSFQDKLQRLQGRNELNELVENPCVHFIHSFHPNDELTDDTMRQIATKFMRAAGMQSQPYLVYRHMDTLHPHFHILGARINRQGEAIQRSLSELKQLRQYSIEMDKELGLHLAEPHTAQRLEEFRVTSASRVVYGEVPLQRAISDVLNTVIDRYAYTSVQELNAILGQYNVKAVVMEEDGHSRRRRGVLYAPTDEAGKQIRRGIPGTYFSLKPTIHHLEQRFTLNHQQQALSREHVKLYLDWHLRDGHKGFGELQRRLAQENIYLVVKEQKDREPELFFVDHQTLAAFAAETLGDGYSLQGIRDRCLSEEQVLLQEQTQRHRLKLRL